MKTNTSPMRNRLGLLSILVVSFFFLTGIFRVEATIGTSTVVFGPNERAIYKDAFDDVERVVELPEARSVPAGVPAPPCPPQTVATGTVCVVPHTLILGANENLNCRGRKLVPTTRGRGSNLDNLKRSIPEVAIFINGDKNVHIEHCVLDGFDFGIFAINGKNQGLANSRIQINDNRIDARFVGISLMSVDDAEIKHNVLGSSTKGGRGIYVGRDSDRNKIVDNQITVSIPSGDTTPVFRAPGVQPPGVSLPSNPVVTDGSAVLITQIEGPEPSLLSAIIEDSTLALCGKPKCLFQLKVSDSATSNELFSADNIFDGNRIHNAGKVPIDGVVVSIARGTRVSRNVVKGSKIGIRAGVQSGPRPDGFQKQFPGTCETKPTRFCLDTRDCNIDGIDAPPMTDTCNRPGLQPIFWASRNTTFENNQINASTEIGIATAGEATIITGNTIIRSSSPFSMASGIGIRLAGPFGLGSTTVVNKNIVKGSAVSLNLIRTIKVPNQQPFSASNFGAKISLNDFIGYTTAAVSTTAGGAANDYNLLIGDTELSINGRGNFWGTVCPRGLPAAKVQPLNPRIKDSHPYGVRVARASPEPSPCKLSP